MNINDRFQQLQTLLDKLKTGIRGRDKRSVEGQIVQILKTVSYFRGEAQIYGVQVLTHFIPLIQAYILRAGMQIIDLNEEYVVLQGEVRGMQQCGELGNIYNEGMLIDPYLQLSKPQPQRQTFACSAQSDAKLIKVLVSGDGINMERKSQALQKFRKDKVLLNREIQKIINSDHSVKLFRQKIKKFQFFQTVPSYDINDLMSRSKFSILKKGATVHKYGTELTNLCFVISGQIKIDNSVPNEMQGVGGPGRLIIQKYMIHKKQNNFSVVSYASAGDWIGLQQYFCGEKTLSTKSQVISHDTQLFFIDTQIFKNKFNEVTFYHLINKLKRLSLARKQLIDRSMKVKKDKQNQLSQQKARQQAMLKLQNKLRQTQTITEVSQKKIYTTKKSDQKFLNNNRKSSLTPSKQFYMPDSLVHHVKVTQKIKNQTLLPKLQQRFILFPQQYQHAFIPKDLKYQLRLMNQKRNKNKKKQQRSFKMFSNQKLNEKIIFDSLCENIESDQQKRNSTFIKNARVTSIQKQKQSSAEYGKQKKKSAQKAQHGINKFHHNNSIYNNFRVVKNREQRLLENLHKTLEIN